MIIIQTEAGAIVTDPKEIYIDKDLDRHLHKMMYKEMDKWLFIEECPHCAIRMRAVLVDIYGGVS